MRSDQLLNGKQPDSILLDEMRSEAHLLDLKTSGKSDFIRLNKTRRGKGEKRRNKKERWK